MSCISCIRSPGHLVTAIRDSFAGQQIFSVYDVCSLRVGDERRLLRLPLERWSLVRTSRCRNRPAYVGHIRHHGGIKTGGGRETEWADRETRKQGRVSTPTVQGPWRRASQHLACSGYAGLLELGWPCPVSAAAAVNVILILILGQETRRLSSVIRGTKLLYAAPLTRPRADIRAPQTVCPALVHSRPDPPTSFPSPDHPPLSSPQPSPFCFSLQPSSLPCRRSDCVSPVRPSRVVLRPQRL
jgi:hypothetical protein